MRYRIDGVLQDAPVPSTMKRYQPAIVSRIKILANLDIAEKRLPQDGRVKLRRAGSQTDSGWPGHSAVRGIRSGTPSASKDRSDQPSPGLVQSPSSSLWNPWIGRLTAPSPLDFLATHHQQGPPAGRRRPRTPGRGPTNRVQRSRFVRRGGRLRHRRSDHAGERDRARRQSHPGRPPRGLRPGVRRDLQPLPGHPNRGHPRPLRLDRAGGVFRLTVNRSASHSVRRLSEQPKIFPRNSASACPNDDF
jgi:hypothetical protein